MEQVLKTSGGFHTSLMEPAKAKLGQALDEVLPKMQPPWPQAIDPLGVRSSVLHVVLYTNYHISICIYIRHFCET